MLRLNISEIRRQLPDLTRRVARTRQEVLVTLRGKPLVKMVPLKKKDKKQDELPLRGLPLWMSDDFDEPLTDVWEKLGQ